MEDAAEGILLSAERYNDSQPVNLGSSNEISIRDGWRRLLNWTGFEGEIWWNTDRPNGQPRRKLDVTRAWEYFGFESQMPFEEGLRRTIEWYRSTMLVDARRSNGVSAQ